MRFAIAAVMLALSAGQVQAAFITAQSSSLTVKGFADADTGDAQSSSLTVTDSQLAATGLLSATLGGFVVDSVNNASVTTTGSGSASWISDDQGTVAFNNLGWTTVNASTSAYSNLFGTKFVYSFVAQSSGTFTVNYNISVDPASTSSFGLQGFTYSFGSPPSKVVLGNSFDPTASGVIVESIVAGNAYSLELSADSNIFGPLGTRTSLMNAQFDFTARGDNPPPSVVPEPTSLALAGFAGIGMAAGAWRRRRQQAA